MTPAKDIKRLLEIMSALRNPDTGCPWDIEQDFNSIIPYTIEEVYEVVDAIKRGDKSDLCDELGDLLLQVVYYAQMAQEEGNFDFGDVVHAITTKMIRRHPHVFGSEQDKKNGLLKNQWDKIKAEEKSERQKRRQENGLVDDTQTSYLSAVRTSQPTAQEAMALQIKAADVGFDWTEASQIIEKIEEELLELKQAIQLNVSEEIETEFGDLYFTLINLARRLNVDPDKALVKTNQKFRSRFGYIENTLKQNDSNLNNASLAEMEELWLKAKQI